MNNTTYKKYYLNLVFAQTPPNSAAAAAAVTVAAVCAEPVWGGVCPTKTFQYRELKYNFSSFDFKSAKEIC